MNYFWLDASAVVKRYITELNGTPEMRYFLGEVPAERMIICRPVTVGEVMSIFVRRKNRQQIDTVYFDQVKLLFETEISQHPDVVKVYPTNKQADDSVEFIETYSINSTDAYILQCALDKANELREDNHDLILVSSDKRLIRAAKSEELRTFDPETDTQTVLDVLINSP